MIHIIYYCNPHKVQLSYYNDDWHIYCTVHVMAYVFSPLLRKPSISEVYLHCLYYMPRKHFQIEQEMNLSLVRRVA